MRRGEAYDKVAKLLGLGYPGGPILDRLAAACGQRESAGEIWADQDARECAGLQLQRIEDAVLYHVAGTPGIQRRNPGAEEAVAAGSRGFAELLAMCSAETLGLVREFQNAVVRDLVERTMMAAEECEVQTLLVSGGVSANSQLRAGVRGTGAGEGAEVFFPDRALSTDNAAMIAAAAYWGFCARESGGYDAECEGE